MTSNPVEVRLNAGFCQVVLFFMGRSLEKVTVRCRFDCLTRIPRCRFSRIDSERTSLRQAEQRDARTSTRLMVTAAPGVRNYTKVVRGRRDQWQNASIDRAYTFVYLGSRLGGTTIMSAIHALPVYSKAEDL